MSPRLLVATANEGKLREIRALLQGIALVGLREVGIDDLDEPWDDFVANAVAKAREASRRSGLPALADDSGLCVDRLGGAPGVFSARFAGAHGDDNANRTRLLRCLEGLPGPLRGARFRCVVALADHRGPLGPRVLRVQGTCQGHIAPEPRGDQGFGFDPLFVLEGASRTLAELPPDEKNHRSHRAHALARMVPLVRGYLGVGWNSSV
ncbi:MAG: RdgB/HAM1 family non-canonical purine NTP pyrophosphatase [Deltaproteobacteria bacterium]|nr:RdgB/HAM1 family non-canonical purine NTP pyrophosphatase [Deltaproteobacteria bacterium]